MQQTTSVVILSDDLFVGALLEHFVLGTETSAVVAQPTAEDLTPVRHLAQNGGIGLIIANTRARSDEVLQAVAELQTLSPNQVPIVLVCRQIGSLSPDHAKQFGIESVLASDGCTLDELRRRMRVALEISHLAKVEEEELPELQWGVLYSDEGEMIRETAPEPEPVVRPVVIEHPPHQSIVSRKELTERLSAFAEIRPLKQNVHLALKYCRDSQASVDDIAAVVRQDPAISARILQTANSPAYRRGAPVTTVETAAVRLGIDTMRNTVLACAMLEQLGEIASDVLDPRFLWEHSFAVGTLMSMLSRTTRVCKPAEAFMIGLLHDLGRIVLFEVLGDDYANLLREAKARDEQPHVAEKAALEMNHADATQILFRHWYFDDEVLAPIAAHHLSPSNLHHFESAHEAATLQLQLCDTIAHAALLGDSGCDWILPLPTKIGDKTLSAGILTAALEAAQRAAEEMRGMLALVDNFSTHYHPWIDTLRNSLVGPLRARTIRFDESFDPLDVLTARLSFGDGPANMLVARAQGSGQRQRLAAEIDRIESQNDQRGLPLIIVADDAPEAVFGDLPGRPLRVIPQVFRVSAFIRNINSILPVPTP